MNFTYKFDADAVRIMVAPSRSGLIRRLLGSRSVQLNKVPKEEQQLALALADLKALAEELDEFLEISSSTISMSHRLCAALDSETAHVFGLPGLTDYVLETDVSGVLGRRDFRFVTRWLRNGQPRAPKRTGVFIGVEGNEKRVPLWIYDALAVSENCGSSGSDAEHWEALARFRSALEPAVALASDSESARLAMSEFLKNLRVSLTDQFAISPDQSGDSFEIIPFSTERSAEIAELSEQDAELLGDDLMIFQEKLRERGPLNAFRLGPGRFVVVDRAAMPALRVMCEMQRVSSDERREFIRNPRRKISEAVEAELLKSPEYLALDPAGQQEAIDRTANPLFVETEEFAEFSERVIGVERYKGNPLTEFNSSGTTWYPETFPDVIVQKLEAMSPSELEEFAGVIAAKIDSGQTQISLDGHEVPAIELISVIRERITKIAEADTEEENEPVPEKMPSGPVILKTEENFDQVSWAARLSKRATQLGSILPCAIHTRLKDHQVESFNWQIDAWKAGLPGVLNADEQGLGKTLQTISFLVWLNDHMKVSPHKLPILVVAPTSLLRNWEEEVERHVQRPGLGHLVRLYGSAISARRAVGSDGKDIDDGMAKLDLSDVANAVQNGTGHLTWVLTTYQTLTNYQHSLGRIPFATAVFDEIQNIKNPGTLAANAARAMNADFRIGLTGTPIENATFDLWAIMDQLAPGALGSLKDFKNAYGTPDKDNMAELHARVFDHQDDKPALGLRRLKSEVAGDLPPKIRLMHPRVMPAVQAMRYDEARVKLATSGKGKALKMLHHIRGVSVHPDVDDRSSNDNYIAASARLSATFEILRDIHRRKERVLVFIEHRKMQYRFIELVKSEFGLDRVDLINGETEIRKRQEVVNRFQEHLSSGPKFDVLVLAPKAAGTGLTLTAATHVIHLSRWWNPAVEEQCNDRVHRIGQTRKVTIHLPQAVHSKLMERSFDLLLHSLMQRKRRMASAVLWPMGDEAGDVSNLQRLLQEDAHGAEDEPLEAAMRVLFARDEAEPIARHADGSWEFA